MSTTAFSATSTTPLLIADGGANIYPEGSPSVIGGGSA